MKYNVGDIIRIPAASGFGFRVWKITGVCLGATMSEDNYQLIPLDYNLGAGVGGKTSESLVPKHMMDTHTGIEFVNS